MDGPIIVYVRICVDPFGRPWLANYDYFEPKKWVFLIIFKRILRSIWDLGIMSFDSPKNVVILVFGNILRFPRVNLAQKWTKTVNFWYILFVSKHLVLKYCSYTGIPLVQVSTYSGCIWWKKGQETPKKGLFDGCCTATKAFEN